MSLKEKYASLFKTGVAVSDVIFQEKLLLRHILAEYHSITCENDMKPECLLDTKKNIAEPEAYNTCPAVTFDNIKQYMDFAKDNKIGVRGHTLVWHNQTPRWFFAERYRTEEDAPLAGRETMLLRMESYIRSVLEYMQQNWPGVIYAWDVVNEAVEDGGLRKSLWLKTVGEDFICQAFRFARKYADSDTALFYNDYDTFATWKRKVICSHILQPLAAEGLIDGMGMQTHLTMESDLQEYEKSLLCFGAFPLQLQITELDIHNADPSEASMKLLAERYQELFRLLIKVKKEKTADITGVTFWGLKDELSWLTGFRKERSYPLLFHGQMQPKQAYYAILQEAVE